MHTAKFLFYFMSLTTPETDRTRTPSFSGLSYSDLVTDNNVMMVIVNSLLRYGSCHGRES